MRISEDDSVARNPILESGVSSPIPRVLILIGFLSDVMSGIQGVRLEWSA